jgi:hypothetical protein
MPLIVTSDFERTSGLRPPRQATTELAESRRSRLW